MAKRKSCNSLKDTCGTSIPSTCVPLETDFEFTSFDGDDLPADPSINDLFEKLDSLIKQLQTSIDLTALNPQCMVFDKNVIQPKDLFQLIISLLCSLKARITTLETRLDNLDLLSETINIDLACLGDTCANGNSHSILYIITTLVSAYCNLKAQVDNL